MADGSSDEYEEKFNRKYNIRKGLSESPENRNINESGSIQTTTRRSLSDGNSKRRKLQLIAAGKDVADFIVGSHRTFEIFNAFYSEWDERRGQSISLLKQLADVVLKSSKESDKITNVISKLEKLGDNIPNATVSFGAKIAAAISAFFAGLFGKEMSEKEVKAKEFEIKQTFQKDIDSTSLVYVHGVQCSSQFEETRQCIKKFHRLLTEEEDLESIIENNDTLEFLIDIAFYNPDNVTVFYPKLKYYYERLRMNSKSAESRNFIRVFEDAPTAIQVINSLAWIFDTDGYDVSVVDKAWSEIFEQFVNLKEFDIKLFLDKIQNCIFFLSKERIILERTKANLLKESL